jgi:hypothetical protein
LFVFCCLVVWLFVSAMPPKVVAPPPWMQRAEPWRLIAVYTFAGAGWNADPPPDPLRMLLDADAAPRPVEAAPVEAAATPVEAAPVEAAPVEATPVQVEAAPVEAAATHGPVAALGHRLPHMLGQRPPGVRLRPSSKAQAVAASRAATSRPRSPTGSPPRSRTRRRSRSRRSRSRRRRRPRSRPRSRSRRHRSRRPRSRRPRSSRTRSRSRRRRRARFTSEVGFCVHLCWLVFVCLFLFF